MSASACKRRSSRTSSPATCRASSSRFRAWPRAGGASTSARSSWSLRKGVKFHNGDEMNADDVVFTFGPERMFGSATATRLEQDPVHHRDDARQRRGQDAAARGRRHRQAHLAVAREGRGGRPLHGALRQPRARRDPGRPPRRRRPARSSAGAASWRPRPGSNGRASRWRPAPTRCASSGPTSLIARCARRLLGRPAADQDASASSSFPKCRAASTAC